MSTVSAPTLPAKLIKWGFRREDSLQSSGWSGRAFVLANPWTGKWTAHVELAAIQGEANARKIKSFIARCKGSTETFQLLATAGKQNDDTGVTVSTAASAGDTSLNLSGWTTALKDGQFLTVNEQLLCCTADQSGDTVTFKPQLRTDAIAGSPVETSEPFVTVFMVDSRNGWTIGQNRLFGIAFDVEEAPLEGGTLLLEDGSHLLLEDGGLILIE